MVIADIPGLLEGAHDGIDNNEDDNDDDGGADDDDR